VRVDVRGLRKLLEDLELGPAFIEHLGWSRPPDSAHAWQSSTVRGHALERRVVAELGDAVVLEVRSQEGLFPEARVREQAYKEFARRYPEHLVVFVDKKKTKSLWCWARRTEGAISPRTHVHLRGQSGGRLVEKVATLHSEMGGREEAAVAEVARGLREAMDTRKLSSRLAHDLQQQHERLTRELNVPDATQRHAYAWVLLYRLLLRAFLQQRGPRSKASAHPTASRLEVRERDPEYFSSKDLRALLFEGRFPLHAVEESHPGVGLPAGALEELLRFLGRYSWSLEPGPSAEEHGVTPAILAESLMLALQPQPQHAGAYRVPPELVRYLCERAVHPPLLEGVRRCTGIQFKSFEDLLLDMDEQVCGQLLHDVLPKLRILDPACGAGVLLVEVMEALAGVYFAAIHRIEAGQDKALLAEVAQWRRTREGVGGSIRKRILMRNLFGVEAGQEAVEAARLRLLLEVLSATELKARSDPWPSLEFNILEGNALIGLTDTRSEQYQDVAQAVWPLLELHRSGRGGPEALPDWIQGLRQKASLILDDLLLEQVRRRRAARQLTREDITALRPLHWCLDFGELLQAQGGFDAILTLPPWDLLDRFHPPRDVCLQFYPAATRTAGRPATYALFIERAFQLLRTGGQVAMLVPGHFYSEESGTGLRQLLLEDGALQEVLGVSNEYHLLDNVHRNFRVCLLVFGKGRSSESFEVAFPVDPRKAIQREELDAFLHDRAARLKLTPELLRQLSPGTLSIPELQSEDDLAISVRLMQFPALEDRGGMKWRLGVRTGPSAQGRLPLHEQPPSKHSLLFCSGRGIHQYGFEASWIEEEAVRTLPRAHERVRFDSYSLVLRAITRNTSPRTLIATVLPPRVLYAQSVMEASAPLTNRERFYRVALLNSFVVDYLIRQRMAGAHLLGSHLKALPIPQVNASNGRLRPVASRAARLICTTPLFDEAARDVGLRGHQDGATEPTERARLQAEIDGLVAHLYGLTEEEFAHILASFPLVPAPQRTAAHNAYRDISHGVIE